MANAKKCDRCGKLFEPYMDDEKFTKLIILAQNIDFGQRRIGSYDLCKECNDSFLEWLSKPKAVKHGCLRFGIINEKSNKCKLCPSYQECKKVTEEKKENKQKGCKAFGAFGGTPYCLTCPQCYECRDVTNSIKEASSNGE